MEGKQGLFTESAEATVGREKSQMSQNPPDGENLIERLKVADCGIRSYEACVLHLIFMLLPLLPPSLKCVELQEALLLTWN